MTAMKRIKECRRSRLRKSTAMMKISQPLRIKFKVRVQVYKLMVEINQSNFSQRHPNFLNYSSPKIYSEKRKKHQNNWPPMWLQGGTGPQKWSWVTFTATVWMCGQLVASSLSLCQWWSPILMISLRDSLSSLGKAVINYRPLVKGKVTRTIRRTRSRSFSRLLGHHLTTNLTSCSIKSRRSTWDRSKSERR